MRHISKKFCRSGSGAYPGSESQTVSSEDPFIARGAVVKYLPSPIGYVNEQCAYAVGSTDKKRTASGSSGEIPPIFPPLYET